MAASPGTYPAPYDGMENRHYQSWRRSYVLGETMPAMRSLPSSMRARLQASPDTRFTRTFREVLPTRTGKSLRVRLGRVSRLWP